MAVVIATAACAGLPFNRASGDETITVGMESTAVNALIILADQQKYFAANGLNVTIKNYPSGLAAVEGMLKNEVDVATAAEFVIVGKAFAQEPIRAWGSIDNFEHNYLIARKDRGIEAVEDLRGKKIGVPLKTAAEFYLGRFFELNQVTFQQVTLVNVSPPDLVNALVNGEVDAVMAWQPNAKKLEDQLGGSIIRWPAQNDQATYCSLLSTDAWTKAHPEQAKRFMQALAQAETFYANSPDETKAILQQRLGYDDAYMAAIWPEHQFQLSLDMSQVLAMEDEARWMINNRLTESSQTPVFVDYLYPDALQAVRPEAVNIIR